jgi:hypothetical protein
MGEKRNAYRILMGKPEGKRSLGRSRRRWGDNIKMNLREIKWDGRDWIDLAQNRDQWRIRWAGHVAHIGVEECIQGFGGKARRKETTMKT